MGLGALGLGGRYPLDGKFWCEIHENFQYRMEQYFPEFWEERTTFTGNDQFSFFTFLPEFPNFRLNGSLFENPIIWDFLKTFPGFPNHFKVPA